MQFISITYWLSLVFTVLELISTISLLMMALWYLASRYWQSLFSEENAKRYSAIAEFLEKIDSFESLLSYAWYFSLSFAFFALNKFARENSAGHAKASEFTPWYALFCFYIPFINFNRPPRLMVELCTYFKNTSGSENFALKKWQIYFLWSVFILLTIFSRIATKAQSAMVDPSEAELVRVFAITAVILTFSAIILVIFAVLLRRLYRQSQHRATPMH